MAAGLRCPFFIRYPGYPSGDGKILRDMLLAAGLRYIFCMNTLWEDDCFGTKEAIPKLSKKRNSPKTILCFVIDIDTILAKIHSCFFIDIGPISMIWEISLADSSGFVGAHLFPN